MPGRPPPERSATRHGERRQMRARMKPRRIRRSIHRSVVRLIQDRVLRLSSQASRNFGPVRLREKSGLGEADIAV